MNLVEANVGGDAVGLGGHSIPLDRTRRPPTFARAGRAILGIRPEAFEDAAFATRSLPTIDVKVEVIEELGSDAHLFFHLDAAPVVVEDALSDRKEDATTLLASDDRTLFSARVDPRTTARVGDTVRLSVDPSRLYFFSPETGETLLGRTPVAA
jgi:multiple sugar transport system ATP-binding protein